MTTTTESDTPNLFLNFIGMSASALTCVFALNASIGDFTLAGWLIGSVTAAIIWLRTKSKRKESLALSVILGFGMAFAASAVYGIVHYADGMEAHHSLKHVQSNASATAHTRK